ncbi:MAG: hypothetical protein EA408_00360, partial [Marinilabiliales bacterium]
MQAFTRQAWTRKTKGRVPDETDLALTRKGTGRNAGLHQAGMDPKTKGRVPDETDLALTRERTGINAG